MLFSVDAHAIGRHLTGNEVYVRNLLANFAALDDSSDFVAYLSLAEAEEWVPSRFQRRKIAGNPYLRLGWDLSRRLWKDRPSLVHVQYTAPVGCPVPVVVSVHDVSFLEHPEYFSLARRKQLCFTVRRTVRSAVKVLTGSEFSRMSIANAYGLNDDKIVVVPNAASPIFRPVSRNAAASRVLDRFGIRTPFVLTVGDLQPRKNHVGLISAFAELVKAHPGLEHRLVLAGKDTWDTGRIRRAARDSGVADRVTFTGFVSDQELLDLYNSSDLFVFPSFYEGFGLPVLEAMACGTAVACSNTSALPEVADSAALLFNPHSTREMVLAMRDLLVDPELRMRMRKLGMHRAAQFSWRRTAEKTLDVYYEVAGSRRERAAETVAQLYQT
jgi:glycosyltransferase involved in cell wall biosynthesis